MRFLTGVKLLLALTLLFAASVTWALRATPSQEKFIDELGALALADVEYARLAVQRASDADLRELASRTVSVEGISVLYLRDHARLAGLPFPQQLDARQQRSLERLRSLSGADFDAAYLELLSSGARHKLDLLEAQASQEHIDELQQYAFRHFPAAQAQFSAAEQLRQRS